MFRRNPDAVAIAVMLLGSAMGGIWTKAAAPDGQAMLAPPEMPRVYMISAAEDALQCPFLQMAVAPLLERMAR